jgi:predicted nucleic acid-binding protein
MRVLDTNFLIDYLNGEKVTKEYYEANGGETEQWVIPVPAYAEALAGEGNIPDGDIEGVRTALSWSETHAVDEHTAVIAGEIASEIAAEGPFLDGIDALIAAVGRELDAPVVSADSDLTHEETKRVVDVEEYRKQGEV